MPNDLFVHLEFLQAFGFKYLCRIILEEKDFSVVITSYLHTVFKTKNISSHIKHLSLKINKDILTFLMAPLSGSI